jgi:hypothetical protein
MAHIVGVNAQHHQALKVNKQKAEEAIADQHMLPVVISEFLKLVVEFPILFSKNADTGHFLCIALLGFKEGENLFWHAAKLNSLYSPLNASRHPFFVGENTEVNGEPILCIDQQSPAISSIEGESLFTDLGQPSHYLNEIQQILAELVAGEAQTKAYIDCLLGHELLVPLKLDITFGDKSQLHIKGLYSIDEDKLNRLSLTVLGELKQQGYLQTVYTQIASLGQIYALIERKNKRLGQISPWLQ